MTVVLSSIRNHIKRDTFILESDVKYDSRIDDCIRSAVRSKEQDKWYFLERIDTMALVEGSTSATLPDDCGSVNTLDVISGSQRMRLQELTYKQLSGSYYKASTIPSGKPVAYSPLYRTLHFSHTADQDYTLHINYFARDENLPTADSDTSVWFEREGYDVIKEQARFLFELNILQNPNASNAAATIALEQLKESHRKHKRY